MTDLDEYLLSKEPDKRERAANWSAAIGLQKVDGLTPSQYLVGTARRNIEGEITIQDAGCIIGEYYKSIYLERFFRNVLMGEKHKLQSRYMLVGDGEERLPIQVAKTPLQVSSLQVA